MDTFTKIIQSGVLGLWHSLRGLYRFCFYDKPKTCSPTPASASATVTTTTDTVLPASAHAPAITAVTRSSTQHRNKAASDDEIYHQLQQEHSSRQQPPLTSLAQRRLQEKAAAAAVGKTDQQPSNQKNQGNECGGLLETLLFTLRCNAVLFVFNIACTGVAEPLAEYFLASTAPLLWCCTSSLLVFIRFASQMIALKLCNVALYTNAAEKAYVQKLGRLRAYDQIEAASDLYASTVVQIVYYVLLLLISAVVQQVAVLGDVVVLFLAAPYWSLYVFEYSWYYMGVPFNNRLRIIEQNWPYFVGFGLLLASICTLLPPMYGTPLSMFVLPFLIISAIEASAVESSEQQRFTGFPVRFFSIPVWVTNQLQHLWMIALCLMQRLYTLRYPQSHISPSYQTSEASSSRPSTPDCSGARSLRRSVTPDDVRRRYLDSNRSFMDSSRGHLSSGRGYLDSGRGRHEGSWQHLDNSRQQLESSRANLDSCRLSSRPDYDNIRLGNVPSTTQQPASNARVATWLQQNTTRYRQSLDGSASLAVSSMPSSSRSSKNFGNRQSSLPVTHEAAAPAAAADAAAVGHGLSSSRRLRYD